MKCQIDLVFNKIVFTPRDWKEFVPLPLSLISVPQVQMGNLNPLHKGRLWHLGELLHGVTQWITGVL